MILRSSVWLTSICMYVGHIFDLSLRSVIIYSSCLCMHVHCTMCSLLFFSVLEITSVDFFLRVNYNSN